MSRSIRVRFAPSPTGPLHIGGVRTALYNYLFARKHGGKFILRIEDTDQLRYVPGAEKYIIDALRWSGLTFDEGVDVGGDYGPYRQSDRRVIYTEHVNKLVAAGHAYYAFDTPEDLEEMRQRFTAQGVHSPKYDQSVRMQMRNSLTLCEAEVQTLLAKGENVTVRMKVPAGEIISFNDEIRGRINFDSSELDDRVIMKADGLPTYHLANVVDDRLMEISHVIRGEEWLSSTAHHVLLYRFFGWEEEMPSFAHLPLILKPTGQGKLSKRDGAKFGFPVFPLDLVEEDETFPGFKETGFLAPAMINFLALLGWNPGTDQEIFDMDTLAQAFNIEQINKSGAQFNYDKAKWFNQQFIINSSVDSLYEELKDEFPSASKDYLNSVISLFQPRVNFLPELVSKSHFMFDEIKEYDEQSFAKKYKAENYVHFMSIARILSESTTWELGAISTKIKSYITENGLKFGDVMPVLRILITGTMEGPDLMEMIYLLGSASVSERIMNGLETLAN